jgi:hypothetical protein
MPKPSRLAFRRSVELGVGGRVPATQQPEPRSRCSGTEEQGRCDGGGERAQPTPLTAVPRSPCRLAAFSECVRPLWKQRATVRRSRRSADSSHSAVRPSAMTNLGAVGSDGGRGPRTRNTSSELSPTIFQRRSIHPNLSLRAVLPCSSRSRILLRPSLGERTKGRES